MIFEFFESREEHSHTFNCDQVYLISQESLFAITRVSFSDSEIALLGACRFSATFSVHHGGKCVQVRFLLQLYVICIPIILKMNLLLSAVVLIVAMASATVSGLSLGAGPMKKVAVFGGTGVGDEFCLMTALFDVS